MSANALETYLRRPTGALYSFNDVFSTDGDADAVIATRAGHLRLHQDLDWRIDDPLTAAYYAELMAKEVDRIGMIIEDARAHGYSHPDIDRAEQDSRDKAIRVILNLAPRKEAAMNGHDFLLAVADNGTEFYATPPEALSFVRHRLRHVLRIPTEGHPLFDGKREQFRSSRIAGTCWVPGHPVAVDNGSRETALAVIPDQQHPLQVAFVDKFGNIRLRARNAREARQSLGRKQSVAVHIGDERSRFNALVCGSLREVPLGQLGIYENTSDGSQDGPGYIELNVAIDTSRPDSQQQSSFYHLGKPPLGTPVELSPE